MFNLEFTVLTRIAYSLSKKEFNQMLLFKSGKREVQQWKSEGGLETVFMFRGPDIRRNFF